jgi:hypothetical protein
MLDGALSAEDAGRIAAVYLDDWSFRLFLRLKTPEGSPWLPCWPAPGPALARQAWAFAQDGRVPAVDLRALTARELNWFATWGLHAAHSSRPAAQTAVVSLFPRMTRVNLHPAWAATAVGWDLIRADQVIFDILPIEFDRIEGTAHRVKLPLNELRAAFNRDLPFIGSSAPSSQHSFYKSIVSAVGLRLHRASPTVVLEPELRCELYLVPRNSKDTHYTKLESTSEWLTAHSDLLCARIRHLARLREIAAITGLFQTVVRFNLPHNLDVLAYVQSSPVSTPDILVEEGSFSNLTSLLSSSSRPAH